jgi:hypothetical protein
MVKSELMGRYHEDSNFRFKFLLVCNNCERTITHLELLPPPDKIPHLPPKDDSTVDIGNGMKMPKMIKKGTPE